MRKVYEVIGLVGVAVVSGCNVGPDYKAPENKPPEAWATPLAGGEEAAAADLSAWWTGLNDPTLDSLIERARTGSLDLKLAEARLREARALRGIVAADSFPTVDANGDYLRNRASARTGTPFVGGTETDLWAVGFDASWEVDVWGRVRRGVEAADADLAAAEESRRDVLVTLMSEVARNYVEVRSFQRRLEVARSNAESQQTAVDLTSERFRAGITSELDVMQARSNLATTRSRIPQLETSRAAAVYRLGVLLGQEPGAVVAELQAAAPVPQGTGKVPVGLPSELMLRRPDIREAERRLASETAQIGVAKADLFPRFSLTGTVGLSADSAAGLFEPGADFWSWGPGVSWRVFDAGKIRSNIRAQEARRDQAMVQYDSTVLAAFEEVENALVAYAQEQDRRGSLSGGAEAAERSVFLAADLYKQGLTDFQNVLDAQRTLFDLQDQLAESDARVTTNLIALYKSLGGGWEMPPEEEKLASKTER